MVKTIIDDGTQTTVLQTVGATTTAIITDTENPETITAKYTISKDGTATTASAETPTSATTNTLSNSCTTTATVWDDSTPPAPATQTTSTTYSRGDT